MMATKPLTAQERLSTQYRGQNLSRQEVQIVDRLLSGWPVTDIAHRLEIALPELQRSFQIIMAKLGANELNDIYHIAKRRGYR